MFLTSARFTELFSESHEGLFAYLYGMLGNRSQAEEITAAAFEQAWRKRHLYLPGKGSPQAWLFTLGRNLAIDHLRRQREILSEDPDSHMPEGDHFEPHQQHPELIQAIKSLPREDRELVALRYWADLDHKAISRITGLSPSNVTTRLSRVTQKLRQTLDQQEPA